MGQTTLRSDAQANRARLIRAARAVFVERGVDAEMKEIAERAGLGVGTIYRNFATKDDLVSAIVESTIDSVMGSMEAAAALPDPVEGLREILRTAFDKADEDGPLIRALMAGGYGHTKEAAAGPPSRILEVIERVVRRAQEGGALRQGLDPGFVALYFITLMPSYIQLREVQDPAALRQQLTDLFWHAVLKPS